MHIKCRGGDGDQMIAGVLPNGFNDLRTPEDDEERDKREVRSERDNLVWF
jgi:hypothetical protein